MASGLGILRLHCGRIDQPSVQIAQPVILTTDNPWFTRRGAVAPLAALAMKEKAWEGRGNACAALRSAPALREPM